MPIGPTESGPRTEAHPNALGAHALPGADSGLVVGIGASAGGLEAFRGFFGRMPANTDMAFVLVQHLAPQHDSLLVDLLGRHTTMPVLEAADGMKVEPGHVYVIPPDATLTIRDRVLHLSRPAPPRQFRWPIDTFFASLAQDQGDCAVSIVLSGTGSDGARGLRTVKERGGFTMAQAGFDHVAMSGMPASAAATGLVDEVLPVEEMPDRLLAHRKHLLEIRQHKGTDGTRHDLATNLKEITDLLRVEVGHDFGQYKSKTLVRRIQRRMQVKQAATVAAYIATLREDQAEVQALFRELLIGVTEFFRDAEAFAALETTAIPAILAGKGAADTVRVWVPGCASGEEAYSIAIALKEAMPPGRGAPKVQIFATDIDDRALSAARAGRYRKPQPGLSNERQARWFTEDGDELCVSKSLREMCIFSTHSAIRDPAFSRLDLVSCRNLLIYMNSELQERLIKTFHYALKPGGFMLLGPSESPGRAANLFSAQDKKHRLYARRGDGAGARPAPTDRDLGTATIARSLVESARSDADSLIDRNARRALEKHFPAYVIVDGSYEVLRFAGDTGRYLSPSSGAASLNLFSLLDKGLRGAARAALQEAAVSRRTVTKDDLSVVVGRNRQSVRLIVEPLVEFERGNGPSGLYALAFAEVGSPLRHATQAVGSGIAGTPAMELDQAASARLQAVERELEETRRQLQIAIEREETINEELKSANEEYQSVNEELQSSNEELETSKEEMQSINEELQTVNAELHSKNVTLLHLNSDRQNLMDSTQIATLFLDTELHVTGFTPATTELFHLRDGDRGRPITEITSRIDYPELQRDVGQVLRTLAVSERELRNPATGTVFLLRMRPYRTLDNVIDGVVLTFLDITEREQHEFERGQLAAIVNSSKDAIIGHTLDGTITSWNRGAERLFGRAVGSVLGKPLSMLVATDTADQMKGLLGSCVQEQRPQETELLALRADGTAFHVAMTCSPVKDSTGRVVLGSTIARDISDRKRADEHIQWMLRELNHRVKNTLAAVQAIATRTLSGAKSLDDFKGAFMPRLMSLASTHNLLASQSWSGVGLHEMVLAELEPYRQGDGERAEISGEALKLDSKTALALGMVVHELTTNAAKYGALSTAEGGVHVQWLVHQSDSGQRLHLRWKEHGGPPVTTPTSKGFGTRLITEGLGFELDGTVNLAFDSSGVVCDIDIPLSAQRSD